MPFYPIICREARIQGQVILHFTINEQGDTSDVEAVAGPPMLQRAAIEEVRSRKFSWVHPCTCRAKREVVFVHTFGDWMDEDGATSIVKWFGEGAGGSGGNSSGADVGPDIIKQIAMKDFGP